jgi:hypothetical protein
MHPGLAVIVSLLAGGAISATVHVARAGVRPVANLALLGPPLSLLEDVSSIALASAAVLVPMVVPFLLALLALGAVAMWNRRRAARRQPIVTRR